MCMCGCIGVYVCVCVKSKRGDMKARKTPTAAAAVAAAVRCLASMLSTVNNMYICMHGGGEEGGKNVNWCCFLFFFCLLWLLLTQFSNIHFAFFLATRKYLMAIFLIFTCFSALFLPYFKYFSYLKKNYSEIFLFIYFSLKSVGIKFIAKINQLIKFLIWMEHFLLSNKSIHLKYCITQSFSRPSVYAKWLQLPQACHSSRVSAENWQRCIQFVWVKIFCDDNWQHY